MDSLSKTVLTSYPVIKVSLLLLYTVCIVFGTTGNMLVFWIVCSSRTMWTATNILIASLALSDVFVCSFVLPLSLYYQVTNDWIFGQFLCQFIMSAFGVVVYVSTLTLTAIATDRYILIVYPLAKKITPIISLFLVFCIVSFSVTVSLPVALFSKLTFNDKHLGKEIEIYLPGIQKKTFCAESWENNDIRKLYTVATLILQFFIPLFFILILYWLIFRTISERLNSRNASSSTHTNRRRSSRTNRMLVSVCLSRFLVIFCNKMLTFSPIFCFPISYSILLLYQTDMSCDL